MPFKPKSPCPVCRRTTCNDPEHERKPFKGCGPRRVQRDRSPAERRRRIATVTEHKSQHGNWCPQCGDRDTHADGTAVRLWADHPTPVGLGGRDDGPLGVMCSVCQGRQGAAVMQRRHHG